ncbi:MAG: Eco57I restriction-modification methylase domain-containing protein [Nanoarchaeota archaeon]|nr:Eco57I restriction-modification methylase domain-containing protein [Nanoarchaeota archaeon]MBU1988141.1 Eco57I restriction-modification methylase domain-containing protein [Nanoarchaeota archaeon]
MNKEEAKREVSNLVRIFKENINQYKLSTYKEAQVRIEFIDKFFKAFGWDVDNTEGNSEQYKEVINEDAIKIGGNTKAPDYAFRIGGQRVFFVEAKKPSVKLKDNPESAYKLRRYAWNVGIPISILTDFEEFVVYDCRVKPNEKDSSSVARIMILTHQDYMDNFDKIWDIFSKESVLKGSFERFVESNKGMKGTVEVDNEFLRQIEKWRDSLAKNIALRNQNLSISELNFAVQKIIDRILFLIIAEYKNIEQYGKLGEIAKKKDIYKNLMPYFIDSDNKYNSGIFDFEKDKLTINLTIDNKIFKDILENLYYPKSPYDYSVLPIEILGKVYERFLGKTIRLTSSHQAKVEEKPEVRKAGGVYYTPEYIVDYIVESTVGKLIKGKTPKQIEHIKILDSACGSGTFLVRSYTKVLDYLLEYYKQNTKKYKKEIYQTKKGNWFLTTEIRKNILLNNIYGVDIDAQAVEVTKLSLLLKVLENETKESVNQQLKLFKERALPSLDKNIKCGNSLVDSSYFAQKTLTSSSEELRKINPFDWNVAFPFKFDVVIGNPPYVKEYTNRESFEIAKNTDIKKYYQGKMDLWYFFTCKALDLMKEGGLHSYIAQNNWTTSAGASILRNKILSDSKILSFFDFHDYKVFKGVGIQTMVFVLEKKKTNKTYSVDYYKVIDKNVSKDELTNYLITKRDGDKIEKFKANINPVELKDETITFVNTSIVDIFERMKNAEVFYLTEKEITNGLQVQQEYLNKNHLKILGSEFKLGDGVFVLSDEEMNNLKLSEKEKKELIKPLYTPNEIDRYKVNNKNNYWVIYTSSKFKNASEIKPYPNIKKHLDRFRKIITTDFKPYGIHRTRVEDFFKDEKIVSVRKTRYPSFSFVNFDSYVNQVYYVIKTNKINMKFLTGLLNSKLIYFWLYHKGKKQGEQLQIDKAPLLRIPIIKKENEQIIKNVDLLIELDKKLKSINLDYEREIIKKQIDALEKQIDNIVYDLYGITDKEKEIIEFS